MYTLKTQARFISAATIVSLVLSFSMPIFSYAQATDGTDGTPNTNTAQPAPSSDGTNGDPNQSGTAGTDGLNGGQQAPPINGDGSQGTGTGETVINTGDSTSQTDATNNVNNNTVTVAPDWSHPENLHGWALWKYRMCLKHPEGDPKRPKNCPPPPQTTITTDNDATVTADQTTEAGTGTNAANGGEGSALINTGSALAVGNAINVANSNIINSSGMLLFLNLLFGQTFDMRNLDLSYFFGGAGSQSGCSLTGCGTDLTVNANNTAVVTNSLVVRAQTGANDCIGDAGCTVNTGDAYAAGNAVNLINTNIIDSNYLLVTMNSFGNLGQDITLPGADFFTQLLAQQNTMGGNLAVNANNGATVTDGTAATADSGTNTATTTEGNTAINSGNAISSATAYNQVNTNLIGGTQVFLLFRVWGDWSGNIQGLPDGMMWEQTPFGIVLKNKDGTPASTGALKGACTISCGAGGSETVNATNTATLGNDVNVFALTGDNKAASASGTAAINTGNAYAAANSVNMVNTNLIGQNWIFMIFNIFGNWNGNISFGHPDLWVGASAETGNPTLPGSDVTYHFTVSNRGDSDATNVILRTKFPKGGLSFSDGVTTEEGESFALGSLKRGETREFVYRATAGRVPDGTALSVPLEATVSSAETDNNAADNTEHLDLVIQSPVVNSVVHGVTSGGYDPVIKMMKTADTTATTTPASVKYTIVITNDGGDAFNVFVKDTLRGPSGNYIGDQEWELGKVKSKEEIKITYTVQYGKDIPVGLYSNTATLHGMKSLALAIADVKTTNTIEITAGGGDVLGVADVAPKQCVPLLNEYIKPRGRNNPVEVLKLQKFLMNHEGMEVPEDGVFDEATIEALKAFQLKYKDVILTPWGLTSPTGSVYATTKKAINVLACDGASVDLSAAESLEIDAFKKAPDSVKGQAIQNGNVGVKPKKPIILMPKNAPKPVFIAAPSAPASTTGLGKQIKNLTSWLLSVASN